jgi:hypothetical protein
MASDRTGRTDSKKKDDTYHAARAKAQERANATGFDVGLEWNEFWKEWREHGLPRKINRRGFELTVEVVSPENLERTQPGHGVKA